jgi:hypothetical protein
VPPVRSKNRSCQRELYLSKAWIPTQCPTGTLLARHDIRNRLIHPFTAAEMDPVAENSTNTLVGGGKVAEDDIPKDGTGLFPLEVSMPSTRD